MKEETKRKLRIHMELSGRNGGHMYTLKCGSIGTAICLFTFAKSRGFNGSYDTFLMRLHKNPTATLAELAVPTAGNKKKPRDNSDVKAAIAALDARKRAMK